MKDEAEQSNPSTGSTRNRAGAAGFTLIETVVMLAIVATLLVLLMGLPKSRTEPRAEAPTEATFGMKTRVYEGHWWVILRSDAVAHHPDCPCHTKTAEAE
jgi:hypothetical protein